MNVVTAVNVTLVACPRVTGPTPLSMLQSGAGYGITANDQFHVTIVGVFAWIGFGDVMNDVIIGAMPGTSAIGPSRPPSFGVPLASSQPTIATISRTLML